MADPHFPTGGSQPTPPRYELEEPLEIELPDESDDALWADDPWGDETAEPESDDDLWELDGTNVDLSAAADTGAGADPAGATDAADPEAGPDDAELATAGSDATPDGTDPTASPAGDAGAGAGGPNQDPPAIPAPRTGAPPGPGAPAPWPPPGSAASSAAAGGGSPAPRPAAAPAAPRNPGPRAALGGAGLAGLGGAPSAAGPAAGLGNLGGAPRPRPAAGRPDGAPQRPLVDQAASMAAKRALDSTGLGAVARRLPGANAAIDKTVTAVRKLVTGGVPTIAVVLVFGMLLALGGAFATGAFSGEDFPLPGEPSSLEAQTPDGQDPIADLAVLMPPGQDPDVRPDTATPAAQLTRVPGWADVVYQAQQTATGEVGGSFGVPWTVLAGLARTQTDFGRRSPYDNIDRNPNRDLAYGVPPGAQGSSGAANYADGYTGPVLLVGDSDDTTQVSTRLAGAIPNTLTTLTGPDLTLADSLSRLRTQELPDAVVAMFGPGETVSSLDSFGSTIDRLMATVKKDTVVYAVTYYDPTRPSISGSLNAAWTAAASRHDNLVLVPWAKDAADSPGWFTATGGLRGSGYDALSRLIKTTIADASSSSGWVMPLKHYTLGSYFREPGPLWSLGYHTGQDLIAPLGTPVYAAKSGVVSFVGNSSWAGSHFVKINHGRIGGNNVETWYAHMSTALVTQGETVQAGQQIGVIGVEGNTTGPHLHMEVWLNGTTMADPMKYLPAKGNQAGFGAGTYAASDNENTDCPVPALTIPIGGGADQGAGPFLLRPEHVTKMEEAGLNPQNPCDQATYVAQVLTQTGAELYSEGDYQEWTSDDKVATRLWTDVIYNANLFVDPTTGDTDCTADVSGPASVGYAIDAIWSCEAARHHLVETAVAATLHDGGVDFTSTTDDGATSQLVSEAQTVAYNYSAYKTARCDNSRRLAGIFPLTKDVAAHYDASDRCDPVANIRAAAQAVLEGESVPVKQRATKRGRYQPMIGGWAQIPWALGTQAHRIATQGPARAWSADDDCVTATQLWLADAADQLGPWLDAAATDGLDAEETTTLGHKLSRLGGPRNGACRGARDTDWYGYLVEVAGGLSSAATPADPGTTDTSTTGTGTTGDSSTVPGTQGPLSSADADAARNADRFDALAAYFGTLGAQTTTPAARPGRDTLISRLSPEATRIPAAPPSEAAYGVDSFPIAETALGFAVGYGGIRPDWDTASADVLTMGGLLPAGVSAGVSSADVDTVIAAAKAQIGVPYSWGGGGPAGPSTGICKGGDCTATKVVGFDCSGLTEYAYAKIGAHIGGTTATQQNAGTAVGGGLANALPGDLLLWGSPVYHVAIYLGNGQMIEAPHPGGVVQVGPVWGSVSQIRRIVAPASTASYAYPATTADAKALAAKLTPVHGEGYAELFTKAGAKYNLDPALLAGVAMQESGFNPANINCSNASSAGALGIMQFMPATAAGMGVKPCDPASAIDGAGRYIRANLNTFGSLDKALAAYNWGPGNVSQHGMGALPAETRDYITKIPGYCRQFGGCQSTTA